VVAGSRTERSLWPWADSGFGPLPPLLVVMTVVTGVVDAVSYLALGHVFVANMTGNVVFLGFALAGAGGLSVPASLVALAGALLVIHVDIALPLPIAAALLVATRVLAQLLSPT
jgi:uncharacterized membrane protein YoaK (UPF0700 family)